MPTMEPPYDELRGPEGAYRPRWKLYFDHLAVLGERKAKARWTQAKQLLQENGTSYNVHGDALGSERPWRLSPIPILLDAADWQELQQGLAQRARLLATLLADLYGPQHVLAEGDLPRELVFDNPRFLRALHGSAAARWNWLPLYAADLIRAPNGSFQVLEDCTQAPAGMGYALENRIVVGQVLPELLRDCNVERLTGFFRSLQERLRASAPHNRDTPRIALLTPGPYSATYFEQAYLAKYLGISLVQGGDLTVRGDRVHLKTLGGLQPIDVLLRRVFDDYCDPLELRPDSALGVPALVQALRSGNVGMLNPLGTGLLETTAILAYLPRLSQKLLGEELVLPSVPTFYCGDPAQLAEVLATLDDMVVKPIHPLPQPGSTSPTGQARFVRQLDAAERGQLEQELRASPGRFVAQRFVPAAKTPVIAGGDLRSRAFVLRCFASCSQPNDYQVMPGGLGLVATSDDEFAVSLHRGARSKDVWVLSEEPILDPPVVSAARREVELSRSGGELPSRVADDLFWLGRYTERAEATARLARVLAKGILDAAGQRDSAKRAELGRLVHALRLQTRSRLALDPVSEDPLTLAASEAEVVGAVADPSDGGSLVSSLHSALRVGKQVRDRISHDTWWILASLEGTLERLPAVTRSPDLPRLVEELRHVIISLAGFGGLVMDSMTRAFAWRFLDMGRRLERALHLVTLLRGAFVVPCTREVPLIEAVLQVADSSMTYRSRYPYGYQKAPAVDLLLADDSNPRSVAFQVKTLGAHIGALPPLATAAVRSAQRRLVLLAASQIELSDIDDLCRVDQDSGRSPGLDAVLLKLAEVFPALSASLAETYLHHADVARHLRQQGDAQAFRATELR